MMKILKKIILSTLSVLGISMLTWIVILLNPNFSYAHKTQFEHVTVFHNQPLEGQTEYVINDAISIIKKSALFDEKLEFQLCLNDDEIYPELYPLVGDPLAYGVLNKTVLKNCTVKFNENIVEAIWEINNNELRKFDLTWLLAHEFMHNQQFNANRNYVIGSTLGKINWKMEGHAEYIARGFKNDNKLLEKIGFLLNEETKKHSGLPVFELEDGTKQIFSYFKYGIVIQYLMEVKELNFYQICELDSDFSNIYREMLDYNESQQ